MTDPRWQSPIALGDLDVTFPTDVSRLMPDYADIPADFKHSRNPWVRWQQQWFYRGLQQRPVPRQGIDVTIALRHLGAIQRSFEPKHEHKEAAVAYLASIWFAAPQPQALEPACLPANPTSTRAHAHEI